MKGQGIALAAAAILTACLSGCSGPEEHRHEIVYVEGCAPTCTEAGLSGYWECTDCGARFSDEAGEHPAEPEVLSALGHNFAVEETPATCEEAGLFASVCLRCGLREEEAIPATEHLFGSWFTTREPTCGEEGEETRVCALCGRLETRPLSALVHEFDGDNTCLNCDYTCVATPGLSYTPVLGADGNPEGYAVSRGTAEAEEIVIAPYHERLPVVAVADDGFRNSIRLRSVRCYAPIRTIGTNAFRGCAWLEEIVLPESVEVLEEAAFYACSAARTLSIGSRLTSVAPRSFYGMQQLETISVSEDNPVYAGEGNCLVERATGILLLGAGESVIPDGVRSIADYAFYDNRKIESVELPAGVISIGVSAFGGCEALTSFAFRGTESEWARVEKGQEWRDHSPFGEIRFGSKGAS